MGNRRLIDPGIWRRDWFLQLSDRAKLSFVWSWTNDAVTAAGVYRIETEAVSRVLGFPVIDALREVQEKSGGKVVLWERVGLITITRFLAHQGCSGNFLLGAVRALFELTDDAEIIRHWLSSNRMTLRGYKPAIKEIEKYGWRLTAAGISVLDGNGYNVTSRYEFTPEDEASVEPENSTLVLQPEPAIEAPKPKKKEPPQWGKNLSKEQGDELLSYWMSMFVSEETRDRIKMTSERESKLRARSREGLTFIEAKLAILGCYLDGKKRWGARLTNRAANDFALIFRNDSITRRFIDYAREDLEQRGKRISRDGTHIVSIGSAE